MPHNRLKAIGRLGLNSDEITELALEARRKKYEPDDLRVMSLEIEISVRKAFLDAKRTGEELDEAAAARVRKAMEERAALKNKSNEPVSLFTIKERINYYSIRILQALRLI